MKFLIDMNLSPDWVSVFEAHDIVSLHWSKIGRPDAKDHEIFQYARENKFVIFTHDLDFGAALALSRAESPKRYPGSDARSSAAKYL
jgi:predicted nuclease of predicted toxin-antitoxin system